MSIEYRYNSSRIEKEKVEKIVMQCTTFSIFPENEGRGSRRTYCGVNYNRNLCIRGKGHRDEAFRLLQMKEERQLI